MFAGCSLFYPNDPVEYPEEISDTFNFAGILVTTYEKFSKLNYEDLFNDNFEYHGNDYQVFFKRRLLDRLNQIEGTYDSIGVKWDTTSASNEPDIFDKNDTITLYRKYEIFTGQASDTLTHKGRSRFDLVFHSIKNTWTIIQWYDEHDLPGVTFFHPEYRE